jgi:predicted RNA-binding protein with PIN domain
MAYLIDGNNVIGQTPGWHRDKRGSRFRLLDQLAQFQRVKKSAITVVFDGAPESNFPDGSSYKGVKILYADRNSDADTRIKKIVESHKNARSLTVVTSDNSLIGYVRSCSAVVVRSGEFRKEMDAALAAAPAEEGSSEPDSGDIKGWMRYFGVGPEDDDDY